MPALNNLLLQVQKAYDDCLMNVKTIDYGLAVSRKLLKKLYKALKKDDLSKGDTMRYESGILQIKSMRKRLFKSRKAELGYVGRNEKPSDRIKWTNEETAFRSRVLSGVIMNLRHKDPMNFLDDCTAPFKRNIRHILRDYSSIKVNTVFCGEFTMVKNSGEQIFEIKYMNTKNYPIYQDIDLEEWFRQHVKSPILKKLEEFQERDSGWALVRTIHLAVNINKFTMLKGYSYIDLPKSLKNKKALVNVKNDDEACFAWAITSALYPVEKNSDRMSSYPHYSKVLKLKGITFPMTLKLVPHFENLNNLSVNIYILQQIKNDKYDVLPAYLTKQKRDKHVNLLMVQNIYYYDSDNVSFNGCNQNDSNITVKYHFVWIKDLSRLLSRQLSKHNGKKFLCDRCCNYFYTQEKLDQHTEDCISLNECRVKVPFGDQKIVTFKNYKNREKVPFVIYADMESILKPVADKNKYQEHVPAAIGYYVKCSYDDSLSFYRAYRGEDCIEWFTRELKQFSEDVETVFLCPYDIDPLTVSQEAAFRKATYCHICGDHFKQSDKKVRDHFHLTSGNNNRGDLTTNYRGPAHDGCNILYQDSHVIPIIFHNLSGYDAHFIIKSVALGIEGHMSLLPITKEKYISFTKYTRDSCIQFRFIDSLRFMGSSLEKLVDNLPIDQMKILKSKFPHEDQFKLVSQKGVYPYDYMTSFDVFDEQQLPPIEAFYNKLEDSKCSRKCYLHAKLVWEKFNIKNLGEYTDLYLQTDILLLADVFEQFRTSCLNTYELDPAHYYTLPGYTWDCMLKYTKINLELLDDINKILFIEKGVRGGLTQVSKRRSQANNKYMPSFDANNPEVYIMYWDINNQYGWSMSNYLPYGEFEWVEDEHFKELNILNVADDAEVGYILEVDLEYPEELHNLHRDIPFCPEHCVTTNSRDKKLVATLENKSKYVIHYRALKQALDNGLKLSKIHRVLQFKQSPWLKPYIDLNTELRKKAKNSFDKDLFKLMNNAVFGKTIENIRKHSIVKLVSKWEGRYGAEAYLSNPRFKSCTIFDENLVSIELNKAEIYFNKPIYLGMSILDIARTSLYDYHYKYMLKVYEANSSLLYTDTDGLIYEIRNCDPYETMKRDCSTYFDTSDYPIDNVYGIPLVNRKEIGLMKDENNGRIVTDFIGLRAKLYTFKLLPDVNERKRKRNHLEEEGCEDDMDVLLSNEGLTKKAKGIKKSVVSTKIGFDDYVSCLESSTQKIIHQNLIKSDKLIVNSITQTKVALNPQDDKRYLIEGSYDTLPWGHYAIDITD